MLAVALDALEHPAHFFGRLAIDAVDDKFGIAEYGIQGRAQLVAHVREELRFVLAGDLELRPLSSISRNRRAFRSPATIARQRSAAGLSSSSERRPFNQRDACRIQLPPGKVDGSRTGRRGSPSVSSVCARGFRGRKRRACISACRSQPARWRRRPAPRRPSRSCPLRALRSREVPPLRVAAILQFPGAGAIVADSKPAKPQTASVAPAAESTIAEPVESMPAPVVILPLAVVPPVLAPFALLKLAAGSELSTVNFETVLPAPQAPSTDPVRRPAALDPVTAASTRFDIRQPERPVPAIPTPGTFALEFYCQRVAGVASRRLRWMATDIGTVNQPFTMRVVADKPEDFYAKTHKKAAAPAVVRAMPLPKKNYTGAGIGYIGKIAAGLFVAAFLWSGARMLSSGGGQRNGPANCGHRPRARR